MAWPPLSHPLVSSLGQRCRDRVPVGHLPPFGQWVPLPFAADKGLRIAIFSDWRIDRYISPTIAAGQMWEPAETAFLSRVLPEAAWFVDVGANLGWFSCLARLVMPPSAPVIALEPAPDTVSLLRETLAQPPFLGIHRLAAAASDRAGTAYLFRSADNQGDNRLQDRPAETSRMYPVPTVPLDDILYPLPPGLGVMKWDIQGHEPRGLRGSQKILSASEHPPLLLLEVWPPVVSRLHGDWRMLGELLAPMTWFALLPDAPDSPLTPTTREELFDRIDRLWMRSANPAEWYCNVVCGGTAWLDRLRALGVTTGPTRA